MNQKLFVGSLSYKIDSAELQNIFSVAGAVVSAQVIMDRDTGRSKGFGFVEMSSSEEADNAIKELNGTIHQGRAIVVSHAKPQGERTGGGGGRFGGGNGRRGGGSGFGGNGGRDRYAG